MNSKGRDKAPSSVGFLLSQVGTYASQRFAQRLGAVELQPPLFRVLNMVDAAEGQSQQAIAEAIGAPASRMVALVDELEQRNLIERRPQACDRRVRALFLTGEGRRLLSRAREIAREHEEDLMRGMSAADRRQLVALLQKLVGEQGIGSGVHPGLSGPGARRKLSRNRSA